MKEEDAEVGYKEERDMLNEERDKMMMDKDQEAMMDKE
tara:strand:+ start:494 stop:607 length:114 start_codon:yes stop_codon:yes gene_type:complete